MTLLEECIVALDEHVYILDDKKTKEIFREMTDNFPITQWGRIEWNKIDKKIEIKECEIIAKLREIGVDVNKEVYILWDNDSLPAIKCELIKIIEVIDDVAAVSFDTWLFCPESNYVIELYHENTGIASVGWSKKR